MKRTISSIYLPPSRRALATAVLAAITACASAGVNAAGAPGSAAGAPARYNLTASGAQQQASIASDADGDAVAVWYSAPGWPAAQGIRARRLDAAGIASGGEISVNGTPLYGSGPTPEVAADKDGNFAVVWSNLGATPGTSSHVYRRRFNAAGTALDAETRLDGPATSEAASPTIAMNASGASVAAWYAYGGGTQIRARRFDAGGVPIGAEISVATMASVNYGPQIRVAIDDAGRFAVAWTEDRNDGANYDVYRRRYDASGSPLGLSQRVNSAITGPQRKVDMAMDAAGNSVIIWDSAISSSNNRILGQRYDSAGFAVGGEIVLAYQLPYPQQEASHAAVTMARASGEFAASWRRRDGQVYLRRYSAAGVAYGNEIAASTTGTGNTYPRLASDADGDVSLLWRDDESSTSNDYGVTGRRYAGQASIDLGADLSGSIDASTAPATLEYRLDVQNRQPATTVPGVGSASGIVALVNPPADATLLSAAGVNWYCDTGTGVPRCTHLAPLAAGAVAAPLIVRVSAGANPSPVASVQISGNQYDAVTANDADTVVLNLH